MTNKTLINLSSLEEYSDGDPEILAELLEAFYDTAESSIDALKQNISSGENPDWHKAAHKLKGASGYVGASRLTELCVQAEQMTDCDKSVRENAYTEISHLYSQICTQLKNST